MQQLEVGAILEGKITGVRPFGAFVDLGEGKSGLVHISEISRSYVTEISDYVKEGQIVKVKVLNLDNRGKIELSIKQADENFNSEKTGFSEKKFFKSGKSASSFSEKKFSKLSKSAPSFEDMLSNFKKMSDQNFHGLKSKPESKRSKNFNRNNNA